MLHALYVGVDELIAPATLSRLAGRPITTVESRLLTPEFAKSGSRILLVETEGGAGPRFILKRVSADWDWLMRATDDEACRSVTLWQRGVFDRLPPSLDHAVVACARDGEGYAILMRDVGEYLYVNKPFSPEANRRFLDAMAEMHAAFFEDMTLLDLSLSLCRLDHVYGMFSPRTGRREAGGPDELPRRLLEGWEVVERVADPEAAQIALGLLADLTPLCEALGRYPHTLVHGDWRHANQGLLPTPDGRSRVVLLDWQLAAFAPPAVELGRYLGANAALLPGAKEESLAYYSARLAALLGPRFSDSWWRPQLALGLLGGFVQDGWAIALKATTWHVGADARELWRADLRWWSERVREGAQWL